MKQTNTKQYLMLILSAALFALPVTAEQLSPSQRLRQAQQNYGVDELYDMAKTAKGRGQAVKAKSLAQQALAKQPGHIKSLEMLAVMAKKEEDYSSALKYYDTLLSYHPKYMRAYLGLAECYKLLGNTDKEEAALASYRLKK